MPSIEYDLEPQFEIDDVQYLHDEFGNEVEGYFSGGRGYRRLAATSSDYARQYTDLHRQFMDTLMATLSLRRDLESTDGAVGEQLQLVEIPRQTSTVPARRWSGVPRLVTRLVQLVTA